MHEYIQTYGNHNPSNNELINLKWSQQLIFTKLHLIVRFGLATNSVVCSHKMQTKRMAGFEGRQDLSNDAYVIDICRRLDHETFERCGRPRWWTVVARSLQARRSSPGPTVD